MLRIHPLERARWRSALSYLFLESNKTIFHVILTHREAGLRQVIGIVRERQLRLYGHVARLPAEDPAHRIRTVDWEGLVFAWAMAKRRPI